MYTDASDDTYGAQLPQEDDGQELPVSLHAHNKAADCLSQLVNVKDTPAIPTALINMLVTSTQDCPATHNHSKTHNTVNTTPADPMTTSTNDKVHATLTED